MMRQLSTLSEREQDNLFYIALERVKSTPLSNLLARLYLSPASKVEIMQISSTFKSARLAVRELKRSGITAKLINGKYELVEIDDGEPIGVRFNDIRPSALA